MTDHYSPQSARGPIRALRLLALTVVSAGVLVLLAAAFVLSYPGIHAMALHAGVSPRLARGYPVIFDAVLAIACAALLALRGGGLVSRCYAWLSLLVVLAGAAGADALHSTGTRVPHRPAAATAAVLPWVLALIGFGLLLAVLRHARKLAARQAKDGPARGAAAAGMPAHYVPATPPPPPPYAPDAPPHVPALEAAPPATVPPAPAGVAPAVNQPEPEAMPLTGDPMPAQDVVPAQDAVPAPEQAPAPDPAPAKEAAPVHSSVPAEDAGRAGDQEITGQELSSHQGDEDDAGQDDSGYADIDPLVEQPEEDSGAPAPAFHRMWSSPTPPGDDDQP
ncbi:MAG TPA: DUF2637 domain-containing protein [Streptosporangiaceae bacterium]|jgi:hypothetical protein